MPNRLHQFKLKKSAFKTFGIKKLIDGRPVDPEYAYECKRCDTEIKIKKFMTNDEFNRDFFRIYPHVLCLAPNEAAPFKV